MEWDLDLFKLGFCSSNRDVEGPFRAAVDSLSWRREIAGYHVREYRRIISNWGEIGPETPIADAMDVLFTRESRSVTLPCESHLIAAAQSIHAMHDFMAVILYYGLRIDKKHQFKLKSLGFNNLLDKFGSDLPVSVRKQFDLHKGSDKYRYLNAFVNRAKHTSLVRAGLSVDFVDNRGGFRIKAFKYHDEHYPQKWSDVFIADLNLTWAGLAKIGTQFEKSQVWF